MDFQKERYCDLKGCVIQMHLLLVRKIQELYILQVQIQRIYPNNQKGIILINKYRMLHKRNSLSMSHEQTSRSEHRAAGKPTGKPTGTSLFTFNPSCSSVKETPCEDNTIASPTLSYFSKITGPVYKKQSVTENVLTWPFMATCCKLSSTLA